MALVELTCDSLGELQEGRARLVINKVLAAMMADLDDRGDDEKPRTVTITVTAAKRKGLYLVEATAKSSLPAYKIGATVTKLEEKMGRDNKGSVVKRAALLFEEHDASNPDQRTVYDEPGMQPDDAEK